MPSNLTTSRTQSGLGAFAILLYALYGAYIGSLYILKGDKGGMRSADFLLFLIVLLLLVASNLGKDLITHILTPSQKSIIIVFIMYMLLRWLFVDSDIQLYYLSTIFPMIGRNFTAGFIANAAFKSRLPIISGITHLFSSIKGTRRSAAACTLMFITSMIYFLITFQGTSPFKLSVITILATPYYQDYGDYIILAYCCLIYTQISYWKNSSGSTSCFLIFTLVLLAQTALAFVCLQIVTSNKSVLVITLISLSAIYLTVPKSLSTERWRPDAVVVFVILFPLFLWLLLSRLLPIFDFSQMRIFDYGETFAIVNNSSLLARWQHFVNIGIDQILSAPLLGDFSLIRGKVVHSSLISVQTQLGIIGTILLWSFIAKNLYRVILAKGNERLKSIAFPILLVSLISSDFVWGPLWFLIGALYEQHPAPCATIDPLS